MNFLTSQILNAASHVRSASPLFFTSGNSVPTYFIHGNKDEIVPVEQSMKAHNLLIKHNIPTELILLKDIDHDLLSINLESEFGKVDSFLRIHVN